MLCQHCNKNQAAYHFMISDGNQQENVHLCADCAQELGRQYMQQINAWSQALGGWRMQSAPGYLSSPFSPSKSQTEVADQTFSRRRKLSQLRHQLQQAVEAEDYEAAARLRDEIKAEKRATEALNNPTGNYSTH